jgi:hypothetical protein
MAALGSGAILLSGLLGQTAQAQSSLLGTPETSPLLTANSGSPGADLQINYSVTETSGLYTYAYTVVNPGSDTTGNVDYFSVDFNANPATISLGPSGGSYASYSTGSDVYWYFPGLTAGQSTAALSLTFTSPDAPVFGNADATGNNPPGPWASASSIQQVPVPGPVPEPTTDALFSLTLLLLPFRRSIFKTTRNKVE